MPRTCRPTIILCLLAALTAMPLAHAAPVAPASGLTLHGVAFPVASVDEADSMAHLLGFERLVRTGPGWRVVSRLRNGALIWYGAGHDSAFGGHGDTLAVPLFTGLPKGIDVGLPVGEWTVAEAEAEPMPHRNTATHILAMVAEVPDLDAACKAWSRAGGRCGDLVTDLVLGRPRRAVTLPGGGRIDLVAAPGATPDRPGSGKARWLGVRVALVDIRVMDDTGQKTTAVPTRVTPLDGRTNLVSGIQMLFVPR